ncbi:MAG TPA: EscU/YscU/HrcU family type III secretion system export apparatus switch protein [Chitinispirillaceae bacterium]|jgi:flagellar biosynthesis protein|nr:EscU/YscU/HrcU family type III secretion system export apparatus switch protein [Chitinispirillaceae bacterium]
MKKADNREKAVALRYQEKKDDAPRVVATGKGLVARKIKEIALANGVPIYQDNDLVELLAQIDIDREIPPELYAAVAEILSWIYKANKELKKEIIPGI